MAGSASGSDTTKFQSDGTSAGPAERINGPPTPSPTRPSPEPAPAPSVLSATSSVAIEPWEIGASVVALILWIALLACGITISSKPFIDGIAKATSLLSLNVLGDLLVVMLCHTATNSAMCCCLAAFLGVIGARAIPSGDPRIRTASDRSTSYASAITRGFFVYLIIQSGAIILSTDPVFTTTLEGYVRLAALSSLISFAVGFNPLLFQNLMNRVDAIAEGAGRSDKSGGARVETPNQVKRPEQD